MRGIVERARVGLRAAAWMGLASAAGLTSPAAAQGTALPSLASYFDRAPTGATPVDADGFVRRWLLLEPIAKPNPTNTGFTGTYIRETLSLGAFPGRLAPLPRDGQSVKAGQPLRWHALQSKSFDVKLFNFAQALGKPTYGVIFWAVTVIDSPREMRNVRMAIGSNSASMWWLNDKEATGLFNDRRMVMDDVVSDRLTLRKGRNIVRGAVINGPGLSSFCVRFIGEDGQPIRDLTTVAK